MRTPVSLGSPAAAVIDLPSGGAVVSGPSTSPAPLCPPPLTHCPCPYAPMPLALFTGLPKHSTNRVPNFRAVVRLVDWR
ncbi:uncharacterized [Tachysurus ichikawai]